MGQLKPLGPRPLPLSHLLHLVNASPLEDLLDEDRLRPGKRARYLGLAQDIRDEIDKRHLDVEKRNLASVVATARQPGTAPVRALEDEGTAELVDRLECLLSWQECDAWKHGLLVGLVLGAEAQSTVEGDAVSPLHLMTVVRALLDVAEHLDTEEAMEEGRSEERLRRWAESGKTWWDFNLGDLTGEEA